MRTRECLLFVSANNPSGVADVSAIRAERAIDRTYLTLPLLRLRIFLSSFFYSG